MLGTVTRHGSSGTKHGGSTTAWQWVAARSLWGRWCGVQWEWGGFIGGLRWCRCLAMVVGGNGALVMVWVRWSGRGRWFWFVVALVMVAASMVVCGGYGWGLIMEIEGWLALWWGQKLLWWGVEFANMVVDDEWWEVQWWFCVCLQRLEWLWVNGAVAGSRR